MLNSKKYTKQEKQEAWDNYRADPSSPGVYSHLLEVYIPLIEVLAAKSKSKLPAQVEIGDLINDAFFGLVDAIDKFDESKGYKFETYASTRIKGAINDSLRDYDWVSRYARLRFKLVSQTESALFEELQRQPSKQEVADRIGISLDEVNKIQAGYLNSFSVNIDEYMADSTHETFSLSELLPDERNSEVGYGLEYEEITTLLQEALFSLSEQESIIVYLHIYEGLKFSEIAGLIGVGAQKVTSTYDAGLKKLQESLGVY